MLQKSFQDTKAIIRSQKSKKGRYCNGQKKNDKRTNNYLQNNTQKTKDLATQTPLKTRGELWISGRGCSFSSNSGTRR